jgi:hypothetical protein
VRRLDVQLLAVLLQEPPPFAAVPTATTANIEYSPFETLKPANRNVVSDGIGMHALSATIRMKIPGRPMASITSTANWTIGSVSEAKTIGTSGPG